MNSDTLTQLLQKGFRVTLGATASLIEVLQDPQRRDENLSKLRTDLDALAEEWAAKGEMTEQEARNFVDTIMTQQASAPSSPPEDSVYSQPTSEMPNTATTPNVQSDVKELIEQIAAIRSELEKLREQQGS